MKHNAPRENIVDEKIFMSIVECNRLLGLGQTYLRKCCQAHTIPCIQRGSKWLINVPLLIEQLNEESKVLK